MTLFFGVALSMYPKRNPNTKCKCIITLCVVSLELLIFLSFFLRFSLCFGYQHVGIQNVSESARRTPEKRQKNKKREPNAKDVLGRNVSLLCFSHVFLTFFSRFYSQFLPNKTPTHSVIWAQYN